MGRKLVLCVWRLTRLRDYGIISNAKYGSRTKRTFLELQTSDGQSMTCNIWSSVTLISTIRKWVLFDC